ncbi:MAG: hypothetical protein GY798_18310, partial [Hyphomicrobiales bacterium]|nr:hypothetical protein [Hyphomicrobiales bacterium]
TGSLLAESDAFDFEADPLSVIAVNGDAQNVGGQIALPSGALLSVATDGTYTYDPNGQFDDLNDGETATDSVSFTISDGTDTVTRTLAFTITGETDNLAPIAEDVLYVVSEGAAPGTYSFDVADENPATLVYTSPGMQVPPFSFSLPNPTTDFLNQLDGTFTVIGGQDLQAVALGDSRDFTFAYSATDEFGVTSNQATATLRVIGENDAPQRPFGISVFQSIAEDSGIVTTSYKIIDPDSDNNVADLGYSFNVLPGVSIVDNGNGTYSVNTDEGFDHLAPGQTQSLHYTATDRHGASASFSDLQVFGTNDDPEANDDDFVTGEDLAFAGDLFADNGSGVDSDVDDGDTFVVSSVDGNPVNDELQVIQLASDALLTINPDGTFAYDPNGQFDDLASGETATDSFVYDVTDSYGGTNQATATITIEGVAVSGISSSVAPALPLLDA